MSGNISDYCLAPTTGTAPQTFAAALQFFTAAQCLLNDKPQEDSDVLNGTTYNFIIVGGGSAGCVLANRLSEVKEFKVLLIEAGLYPPFESTVPNLDKGMFGTKYDWQYYTENNNRTNQANQNGSVYWPRAKMLGGSSNLNAMFYIKGNYYDYKKWYDAGNTDWHPDEVTKYFKKAESLQNQHLLNKPRIYKSYGHNGPLIINTFNSTYRDILDEVLKSWAEIGFKNVEDLNVANVKGSGITTVTAASGRRSSTDYTYLNSIRNRDNLDVISNTFVTKVLIHNETKTAYGVEAEQNGITVRYFASMEVIISAGTVNTPQLLMLSGIGNKTQLERNNISCLVDLPAVGQNLQDHLKVSVTIYGNKPDEMTEAEKQFDVIKYLYNKTGSLAQGSISDICAFYSRSEWSLYPEFQNHLSIAWKNSSVLRKGLTNVFNYKPNVVDSIVNQNKNYTLYHFLFVLLHPLSKGTVTLRSSNPRDHPLIFPNYLDDPKDVEATVAGIKMLTKIVNTKYFKSIGGHLGRIDWPSCNDFELDSKDYWKCIALNTCTSLYHPAGTARMGNDAKTSVVSSNLKVHFINGLRVSDASIMPSMTSGNTNGPVIMLAERGAALIKKEYGFQ